MNVRPIRVSTVAHVSTNPERLRVRVRLVIPARNVKRTSTNVDRNRAQTAERVPI